MAEKNHSRRDIKFYNFGRMLFQWLTVKPFYGIRYHLVYKLRVEGKENIPKENNYIAAANHLSTLDPPLVCHVLPRPVAYMAKQELYENPWLCWMLDWLGTFAVNRDKLGVSTIKTAMSIKNTKNWVLGVFPQGTREEVGEIHHVMNGFAGLARATKCNILPMGITGTQEVKRIPFSGQIVVKIGKPISWELKPEEIVEKWIEQIEQLTGFKYVPQGEEQ